MSNKNSNINLNKFKYLKYKKKYLDLKKMVGSGIGPSSQQDTYHINITQEITQNPPIRRRYDIDLRGSVIEQIANIMHIDSSNLCVCMRTNDRERDLIIIKNNYDFLSYYDEKKNYNVYIILLSDVKDESIKEQFNTQKKQIATLTDSWMVLDRNEDGSFNLADSRYVSPDDELKNVDKINSPITALQLLDNYKTVIIDEKINRIIALSDIHSDIHAFIICLRDCAKVIRKKDGIDSDIDKLDSDTEKLLEMDLNTNCTYLDDLNYEWIGDNTYIVICGDILDGARIKRSRFEPRNRTGNGRCTGNNCKDLEYDQVEIKLLKFINAMNNLAIQHQGRIYKILGNHDIANLAGDDVFINKYNPDYTLRLSNYHNGISRYEYFKKGKPGYDLLFQDHAYMFLVINNNIFVHGQIDHNKSLEDYIVINNNLNNREFNINIYKGDPTFWGRGYSRTPNNTKDSHINKCRQVQNKLSKIFLNLVSYFTSYNKLFTSEKKLRVIKGHCVQMFGNSRKNERGVHVTGTFNTTLKNIMTEENIQILSGPETITTMQRVPDADSPILNSEEDYLFGIGMECNKENLDNFEVEPDGKYEDSEERYIIKVDVASSRAFDASVIEADENWRNDYINNITQRTPQVLEIKDNEIKIIRSTVHNMRIHQPREHTEKVYKHNL
jgi:hypothetical protein